GKMKIKLKGRLAWYMHRGYHGLAMPTWNRKIQDSQAAWPRDGVVVGRAQPPKAVTRRGRERRARGTARPRAGPAGGGRRNRRDGGPWDGPAVGRSRG
ncbi:hypothetical protein AB0G81_35975, partial [Streptomyces asoensis]